MDAMTDTAWTDPFLSLEGASNFRDVGGLPVAGGGAIRRGVLLRANQLSGLTERDRATLAPLDVRVIHDLRQGEERTRTPTDWPGPRIVAATERDHLPRWQEALGRQASDEQGARQFLLDLYTALPFDFAPRIALIARGIAEGEGACVVHCSAGKDRTGVVVAVLLALAGVPRDAIVRDYMLTQGRTNLSDDQRRAFARAQERHRDAGTAISDAMHAVLMSVDPAFLDAAFGAIEDRHRDFATYAREGLGLGDKEREAYRRAMIAPEE